MNRKRQIGFSLFAGCVLLATLVVGALPAVPALGEAGVVEESREEVKLPILMYHQVSEKSSKWGKFVISPEEFENDVKLILEKGFTTITVADLIAYTEGTFDMPEKPIMITFDDGYQSDYVYVLPILKKYQVKAVSSAVGAYTELYSGDVHKHVNYAHLCWDEMREMVDSGLVEFQNHSYNLHNYDYNRKGCLKNKNESEWHYDQLIREDFELSQRLFKENLGFEPTCFTYPFGSTNDNLLKHVKEHGFRASLGTYEKINVLSGDSEELYDLKRFNRPHNYNINKVLKQAE